MRTDQPLRRNGAIQPTPALEVCDLLSLGSAELAVTAAGLAGVMVVIASSVPMWNQILRHARGG